VRILEAATGCSAESPSWAASILVDDKL